MKKGMSSGVVILIVLLVIALAVVLYFIFRIPTKSIENCAAAGEISSIPSLGPESPDRECCKGLVEINRGLVYDPNEETADENDCAIMLGSPNVCSDCGNDNCEQWESKCNCPEDCQ